MRQICSLLLYCDRLSEQIKPKASVAIPIVHQDNQYLTEAMTNCGEKCVAPAKPCRNGERGVRSLDRSDRTEIKDGLAGD